MGKLQHKRDELRRIGLLSEESEEEVFNLERVARLNLAQLAFMTLYVNDSEEKLSALDDLSRRISLLLAIINQKFRHKQIAISEGDLISINDSGIKLELDSLSSGEQHELILSYDLLFNVLSNSLVMIDEPELSLHVTWQRAFLPDLINIVGATKFDVLLATHSPQIVGDHTDLMVELSSSD